MSFSQCRNWHLFTGYRSKQPHSTIIMTISRTTAMPLKYFSSNRQLLNWNPLNKIQEFCTCFYDHEAVPNFLDFKLLNVWIHLGYHMHCTSTFHSLIFYFLSSLVRIIFLTGAGWGPVHGWKTLFEIISFHWLNKQTMEFMEKGADLNTTTARNKLW